jgi:choline dehydrogenase-like flavoprotein
VAAEGRRFTDGDVLDAVVIGTGAGGAPILMRLAEAGLDVVALEAGRSWTPERDFATDELAQDFLFWKDERLSAGADPIPFGRNNSGIGVGGSTLHWTAYAPRPRPEDFRLRTEFGVSRDWPLGYAELEPYFDEVEALLGVSGPSPYPWGPPRRAYPLPPAPLNGAAELMARGGAAIELKTAPAPNAVLSRAYASPGLAERPACLNRGFCQAGCRNGAKGSTDVTFLPRALKAGAEVRELSFATGFQQDTSGRLSAVVYRDADGEERRQRCRHVFLCAGAVESPRLLLRSGLANGSDQVGRNFMAHPGVQVWGLFDDLVRPTRGVPGGAISEDMHRPKDADFAGGYLVQSLGVMPVTYVAQLARAEKLWGRALVEHMARFNHVAGVNILGECLPNPDNRLTLSDEVDGRGLPKPRVSFSAGDNEKRLHAHAERLLRELWTAAGARDCTRWTASPTRWAPAAWARTATRRWWTPTVASSASTTSTSATTRSIRARCPSTRP